MPKIFVLRNRLQEQQARLLETLKGTNSLDASSANQSSADDDQTPLIGAEQEQPVALIVGRKSDTVQPNRAPNSKDIVAPGKPRLFFFSLPDYRFLPQSRNAGDSSAICQTTRIWCSFLVSTNLY